MHIIKFKKIVFLPNSNSKEFCIKTKRLITYSFLIQE